MRYQKNKKALGGKGMSLAETLLTLLIMSLVAVILSTGVPVAKNVYERVVLAANAQVLLSTTISTLRKELSCASEVVVSGGESEDTSDSDSEGTDSDSEGAEEDSETTSSDSKKTIVTYYNSSLGTTSMIFLADGSDTSLQEGAIAFQRYVTTDSSMGGDIELLVSPQAATGDLYVSYDSVSFYEDTGMITFENLSVNRASGTEGLATADSYSIYVIASAEA